MTHAGDRVSQGIGVALTLAVSASLYFFSGDPRVPMTVIGAAAVIGPLVTLVRLGAIETAALRAMTMGLGPLFVGVPLTLLAIVRRDVPNDDGPSYVAIWLCLAATFILFFAPEAVLGLWPGPK